MLNPLDAQIIAYMCYYIDKLCRSELYVGNITSERDYVSNIGTHLRFPFGIFFQQHFAISRSLPQNLETKFGCDSIIIFKKKNIIKIGLFEAKWPRYFKNPKYKWDSLNTNNESRFSSQINRQRKWNNSGVVIWEMFFNEDKPGNVNPPFDTFGSNCLRHKDIYDYFQKNKKSTTVLLNNTDLINFLPNSMNFRRIIYNILRCNWGKAFTLRDNIVQLTLDSNESIDIPIMKKKDSRISDFMEETGLVNYIVLDVNNLKSEE